jgi:hypothetical protein
MRFLAKLSYEIELVTLLLLVFASGITYGVLEAIYINTDAGNFKTMPLTGGHFAYYHLCLLSLMTVASFSLAVLHLQWIACHRKKYTILMGVAALPLSLMVEDITWFLVRWRPIKVDEWTVWPKGWSLNLGITYIPLWYLAVVLFSGCLLWMAGRCATQGYKKYLTDSRRPVKMK